MLHFFWGNFEANIRIIINDLFKEYFSISGKKRFCNFLRIFYNSRVIIVIIIIILFLHLLGFFFFFFIIKSGYLVGKKTSIHR